MAAFTQFSEAQLERYLYLFDAGELVRFVPIKGGIENSNYHVTVSQHGEEEHYVLTILEMLNFDEVSFFNNLINHLSYYGLPVAAPRLTADGMTSTIFCGKPTLLVPLIDGAHVHRPDINECRAIGKALGELHDASASYDLTRANPYSLKWMRTSIGDLEDQLNADDTHLLRSAADALESLQGIGLPEGVIHGDLFRDNVLFHEGELSALLDFYHACADYLMQDVAITINDWCSNEDGTISEDLKKALLDAYASERQPSRVELDALPTLLQTAAARFLLTRLQSGGLKDPAEFKRILAYHST